jgi:outer membrane protein assembly factor BamA
MIREKQMTNLRRHILPLVISAVFLTGSYFSHAQNKYLLNIRAIDKDSIFLKTELALQDSFFSQIDARQYIDQLPSLLHAKGFVTASIDSLNIDSGSASLVLFLGKTYRWALIDVSQISPPVLEAVGWRERNFSGKPIDFGEVQIWQQKMLDWLENNGHPFGKIFLDSIEFLSDDKISAVLKLDEGPLYKIDSIRLFGDAKVSSNFLQRYLEISNGSTYNKKKLALVSKKIRELSYVEEEKPFDMTMLATGAMVNLYLRPKRSSQVNVLFGILPNNDQNNNKLLITGEGRLNLKNAFGSGETIGFSFQRLQARSQRLNLVYQHPYLLRSVGLDFLFDMYRRDSVYVNINLQFGASYNLSATQSGKLYLQKFQTIANGINTAFVLNNRRLPDEADVNSVNVGVDYLSNTTDYGRNPRNGVDILLSTTVGTKKIKKNNQVTELKDPGDPGFDFEKLYDTVKLKTYQFRIKAEAAKYFPLGKQSVFKTAINTGIFQSAHIYRNELFQIGGFKLLRGFDEESQYVSQYAIASLEYHYLIDLNSYFYALIDGGWGRNNSQNTNIHHGYISAGLGLAFETGVGVFNLAWAVGKRDDIPFNLRQSKIHFGYVSYF